MIVVSMGLVANTVTYTRLQALPSEDRWCVTHAGPGQRAGYLEAGYRPVPDFVRDAHRLPTGSITFDRNRVLWDAGCPGID